MGETKYLAGLYLRLSKDDIRDGESASIENQRLILEKYSQEHMWEITDTYIDDGWSGTDFRRPAFQRMLQDAQDGRINLIIVKDLSRLGRNHIEVNRLTEDVFPMLGVRFIALADCVDSLHGENDIAIYRNLFNEMQSKDISRKVRTVKRARMERGLYLGTYAPIGYRKNPDNKYHLIIDEETAPIVRRIFGMRTSGQSYRSIVATLNDEHIPSPKVIYYNRVGRKDPLGGKGMWNDGAVKIILQNEVYIGHMAQGKHGTVSYKNRRMIKKPQEQWIRVENTHEPLVSMETWESVRLLHEKNYKPRNMADGGKNIFVGLLKCGDCGSNMRAIVEHGTHKDGSPYRYVQYLCGNYARNGKNACTTHSISEKALWKPILEEIQNHTRLAAIDEQSVIRQIQQTIAHEALGYLSTFQRELKATAARLEQVNQIIQSLYEDKMRGIVSDSMFQMLMTKYEQERENKTAMVKSLRSKVKRGEQQSSDINAWMSIIREYTALKTLTQDVLLALVDHIKVFEAKQIDGQRVCHIHVVYRFGKHDFSCQKC